MLSNVRVKSTPLNIWSNFKLKWRKKSEQISQFDLHVSAGKIVLHSGDQQFFLNSENMDISDRNLKASNYIFFFTCQKSPLLCLWNHYPQIGIVIKYSLLASASYGVHMISITKDAIFCCKSFPRYVLISNDIVWFELCRYTVSALRSLKDQWQNTPPSWGKSDDPCGAPWEGVTCNNSRVTALWVSQNWAAAYYPT